MTPPERPRAAAYRAATELALAGLVLAELARLLIGDRGRRPFLWNEWRLEPLLIGLFLLFGVRAFQNAGLPPWRRPGAAPGRWLAGFGTPEWIVVGAFLLVLSFAAHPGPSLGADSAPLLAQLHTLFFEHRLVTDPLFEPGPALVWLPFYALAHGLVKTGVVVAPADGWSAPYLNAVRLGSLLCALLASLVALRVARRFYPATLAAGAVALAWLASPLLYYTIAEPAMPHAPAALAVAVFLWLWVRAREAPGRASRWVALAAAGAALLCMQRYEVFYFVAPVFDVARLLWRDALEAPRRTLRLALLGAAALLVALLPLFLLGWSRGLAWPWEGGLLELNLRYWSEPRVAEVLFATRGGLLSWTPIAGLGLVGLVLFARKQPALGAGLLLAFVAGVLLLGSNWAWAGSWAFGCRRLAEFAPVLALGLAASLELLWRRPALPLGALAGALVVWNVTLVGLVERGRVPQDATFSFGTAFGDGVRELHEAFGNPAAFPAPWLFVRRHGVAPGRFDELFGREPRRDWSARLGSAGDAQILGRGWSPPLADGGRQAVSAPATLLVELATAEPCTLRVRGRSEDASLEVRVGVNGAAAARLPAAGGEARIADSFFRPGTNEIAFEPVLPAGNPGPFRLDAFELHCGPR